MRALLFLLCLSLTACSLLSPSENEWMLSNKTPEQLAKDGQLGAAIESLKQHLLNHPDDAAAKALLKNLQSQALTLEQSYLQRAVDLWKKNQPAAALAELDIGLTALPDSTALQRRRAYYRDLLDRRLDAVNDELMLVRGRYVADTLRIQKHLYQLSPNDSIGAEAIAALDSERTQLAQSILKLGALSVERKQWGYARWAYNIANDLGAKDQASVALADISKLEKAAKNRKTGDIQPPAEESEAVVLERKRQELMTKYQQFYSQRDWLNATVTLRELIRLFPTEVTLQDWQKQLQPIVNERVKSLKQSAASQYKIGDIDGACALWRQTLQLSPTDSEAAASLERALRVQSNLKVLSEKNRQ